MASTISHNDLHVSGMEQAALQHLNVDSDEDSAVGDLAQSSTSSAQSSIYQYVEENGRTFLENYVLRAQYPFPNGTFRAGTSSFPEALTNTMIGPSLQRRKAEYMLPNDEAEMDRLDLQHQLWMITLRDELVLAPTKKLDKVLDIGTGTGIWAIEFANRNPESHVIGSDLSPIQPAYVPRNCFFEVDDVEDEWNYSHKFDLIHGRAMVTCFKDPAKVFKSAFDSLVPGGYFELQDVIVPMRSIDNTLEGTTVHEMSLRCMRAAENLGTSWKHSANYVKYFEEAGFVDIVEKHFQWPLNRWPKGERMKTLGSYWQEDIVRGLDGMTMAVLTRGGGMTKDEVLAMTAKVRQDVRNKSIHAYMPVIVVYGRRPE